jgi:hypothetical protein
MRKWFICSLCHEISEDCGSSCILAIDMETLPDRCPTLDMHPQWSPITLNELIEFHGVEKQ